MSLFNLDRFRFDKKTTPNKQQQNGSISPESEKENKPARMRSDNSPMKKSDPKVFEDSVIVDSDTDVTDDSDTYEVQSPVQKARVTPVKSPKKSHHRGVVYEEVISDTDEEDRPGPEARVISVKNPHLRRVAREDVITITSDTDEEERRDPNAKITLTIRDEEPASNSSNCDMEQSIEGRVKKILEIFPDKSEEEVLQVVTSTGTLDGAIAACIMTTSESKKRHMEPSSSQDSDVVPPSKKMRPLMETSQDTDEEEEEEEPDWEKHEAMVERLQKKFPDQEKKELKIVLKQHDWIYEDALETLIMFSDPDDAVFSSSESKEEKTNKSKEEHKSSRDRRHHKNSTHGKEASANSSTSTLSTWLTKRSDLSQSPSSSLNSSHSPTKFYSSTLTKTLSKFASATSIAKKEAEERKRKAHASYERVSSGEDDSENELLEPVSSEFEDSEDDLDSIEEASEKSRSAPREQIVKFFQEASLDELTLITSCSLKKAKKIVELRPFDSWESLKETFVSEAGLSEDLLFGCRVVLKERMVVQGLMCKCETISSKMVKHVTQIMENGTRGNKQPSILNSQLKLKPYQMIGLKWLLLLNQHKLSGILADEMGLGKTIQAIAFLAQLFQNGVEGPHLIVVPSSTLDNWVREFKLWCPKLVVLIYYGNQEDRRYIRRDILDGAVNFNVIVTTYNLAVGNHSDRTLFMKLRLNYAVFDEGHMLKNMNTLRYRNLMEINAEHRLLLTGTPLQNNLLELMSLLNFIMPSMFSSSTKQFTKMFSQKPHEEQSPFERDRIAQAKSIMKPFILRRVKSEVLKQLPAKEEIIEYCPMSEKQQTLYQDLFTKLKKSTTGEKRELCNVYMQLRKMANHPLLHRQYYTTEKLHVMSELMLKEPTHRDANADLIQEDMEVMSDFELHRLCQQYTSISSYQLETHVVLDSGKFHYLTELLASLKDKGDRVVLFSQFTMMLDIVEVLMRHLKHRYIRLDGQTPIADRIGLIDDFNTDLDIFVFLLSTKAGGLGINLTSANVVILHDIDFNPYNDKQAEDRCHRLGQTRTVRVIKLVHKDTIEDSMLRLGKRKLKLEQDMTAAEEGGEGSIPEDMASLLKASLGM